MQLERARVLRLVAAFVLTAAVAPGSALAASSSHVTSPADGTYLFSEPGSKLTIEGTAEEAPGNVVDIRCYSGPTKFSYRQIASRVPVEAGHFKVEANAVQLYGALCTVRALPSEEASPASLGPGQFSAEAARFSGPRIINSAFRSEPKFWFGVSATSSANMWLEGAGGFPLESSLYSALAFEDVQVYYGLPGLQANNGTQTRSTVQVDGVNAYAPEAVNHVENLVGGPLPGAPTLAVSKSFDPVTRQLTVREEDPFVMCAPISAYPATKGGCTSLVSAGVTLVRTWQTSNESHLAWMTDTWKSTGGAHTVNARYTMELHSGPEETPEPGAFQFPGDPAFAAPKAGEQKSLPAGPGTILYKTSQLVSDAGDGRHPHAAILYDSPPSEPIVVVKVEPISSYLEAPYTRTVPAGGSSSTLRMAFSQAFSLAEATALTNAAFATYPPSVAFASPANGATITTASPTVVVSGTASDSGGVAGVSVNGAPASLGAGTWSGAATLHSGANTITATAVDQAGLTAASSITVNYAPPPVAAAASPKAAAVGAVSGREGKITASFVCAGANGQSCVIQLRASVLEHLRGSTVVGLSARTRTRTKRVTVATGTLTLLAGRRGSVSLGLNAAGRALLARFGALPVHLTAVLVSGSTRTTVTVQNLTIRPKKKKPHRKHH